VIVYDLFAEIYAILVTTVLTAEVIMWLQVLGLAAIITVVTLVVRRLILR
jgi:hypothetical protein